MGKVSVTSPQGITCYYNVDKGFPTFDLFQLTDGGHPFFADDKEKVKKKYGCWSDVWPSVPILGDSAQRSDENYKLLFGEVSNRQLFTEQIALIDFSQHNVIANTYSKYIDYFKSAPNPNFKRFGVNCLYPDSKGVWKWVYNNKGKLSINKSIEQVIVNTFKEVFLTCMDIGYYIWDIHTLSYRAKSVYGGKNYTQELVSGAMVPFDKLSNHSLGIAIDINPFTNGDSCTVWDIPAEIVQIFRKNGFWWGGEYNSRYDTMHFEYKLPFILETRPAVYFPFYKESLFDSPLMNFKRNEAGPGGFYPIGLMQNLHAGIHLPVEGNTAEVRCLTNGYIIGARLMAKDQAGDNPVLQKFIGDKHLGFVLIRHEIEKVQTSGNPETISLYSLYMHLSPPVWDNAADPYVKNVPWFKKIIEMSFGGVVDLNPTSPSMGKNLWATEAIQADAIEFKVTGGITLKAKNNGVTSAIAKPAPEDVCEAIAAFKKGFMVSFNSPVLPVQAGELIGYTQSLSGSSPTSIHWELFSAAGDDSGLEKLKSIDSDIASLFQRISEEREDNFFEMPKPDGTGTNELGPLLIDKLPSDDQQYLQNIISIQSYKTKLIDFFNKAQSFSKESLDDAKTADLFTYPVSIAIQNPYSYAGPSANAPSTVKVSFKKNGTAVGKKGTLTISNYNSMKFTIQVPADADTISLESDECMFSSIPLSKLTPQPNTATFLKPILSCRWRNIILSHVTEWKPDGLNLLLDKLDAAGYLNSFLPVDVSQKGTLISRGLIENSDDGVGLLKKLLLPLVWWGRKVDPSLEVYGGEHAVCGADGSEVSIFGNLLPADGKIDSMHPVTATWLLYLLESSGKIKIRSTFPNATFKRAEDSGSIFWKGWVLNSPTPSLGETVFATAIQHGYGSGSTVKFSAMKESSTTPLLLGETVTADGVAAISRQIGMWGTWSLKIKDAADNEIPSDDSSDPQLVIASPELQENGLSISPPPPKSTDYTGTVSIKSNYPKGLQGFVYLRYWTAMAGNEPDYSSQGTVYGKTLMVSFGVPSEEIKTIAGVKYKGDFVVGGNGKIQGVAKFGFNEFKSVYQGAPNEFTVFVPLCQKLQAIRGMGNEPKIKIDSVSKDGRTLVIHPVNEAKYTTVKNSADALKTEGVFEVSEEGINKLSLSMPKLAGGAGTLVFSFNPSNLLSTLITDVNPDQGTRLFARPSILIPNGGHDVLGALPENQRSIALKSPDQIKTLCANDFLESHSDFTFPALENAGFGEHFFTMSEKELYINIPFFGDIKAWQNASPNISISGSHANKSKATITGSIMSVPWAIIGKSNTFYRQGSLAFSVVLSNPGVFSAPPSFTPVTYDATPKLLDLNSPVVGETMVILRGKANCMFTDIDLKVICQKKVAENWIEDTSATADIKYTGREGKNTGRCDQRGNFEAVLPVLSIKDDDPRRFVWKRTFSEGKVYGVPVGEKVSSEFTRPVQASTSTMIQTN